MKWNAWGDPAAAKPLSEGIRSLLVQALGIDASTAAELDAAQVRLRPSALSDVDRQALVAVVGETSCVSDDYGRLLRAGGKSTLDLLRRRDSGVQDAPDAVLLPADEDQVLTVLRLCAQRSIAVVPFGGGTSVVGGLDPIRADFKAVVSLDLRRLDALHGIDEVSGQAELGAGVTGPAADAGARPRSSTPAGVTTRRPRTMSSKRPYPAESCPEDRVAAKPPMVANWKLCG